MNPLTDLLPPKARRYVYAGAAFASAVYGVWQAVDGDWHQFAASLLASVVSALAGSNVPASGDTPASTPDDPVR